MGRAGDEVGRFRIEGEAVAGGMGTIFRARDAATGDLVALKLLRNLGGSDLIRFRREAEALSAFHHPRIVRLIDHGVTPGGEAYLAMEWLEGEDLRARLARSGLRVDETLSMARAVAEALAAIHAAGLVHRDVKPGNVFLVGGRADFARLIDFGLVRSAEEDAELTRTGMAVGTPAYMSPEQARGSRALDARSDLFSLGCVMFKCLTGRALFEGSTLLATLARMLLDDVPAARSRNPDVPAAVDALVTRLTRREPSDRIQSAEDLIAAIDALGITEADDLSAPPAASVRSAGLTTGEQRVATMVLVGRLPGPPRSVLDDEALLDGAALEDPAEALAAVVREHRGRADALLDGTTIITFPDAAVATDRTARAAQCALAIRARFPEAPIAVASEWAPTHLRAPLGAAIDRAADLLDRSARSLTSGVAAVAVDADSASLLRGRFEVRERDGGRDLVGAEEPSSGARSLLGRPGVLVGREWEMSTIATQLREAVDDAAARALIITGAAGMGKSRLACEAVSALSREHPDLEVWTARGDALRAASPFALIGQALRGALAIDLAGPGDGHARLAEHVAARVGFPDARRVAIFAAEIVGLPYPDAADPDLRAARADPATMMDRIRGAVGDLLRAATAQHPALIVLEDIQWADAASLRLIGDLLGSLAERPWMALAFARPEAAEIHPRLWATRRMQEVRLKPLSRKAAERLVRDALGQGIGATTVARVVAQADGNAFYLEELVRAVIDRSDGSSDTFPGTVLAMAHARFDALGPDVRRLLRAASIFGDVFWPAGVAALLGEEATADSFTSFPGARDLVVAHAATRFPGEEELAFRHTLVREAAYATLTPEDRALGHRLAAAWLTTRREADAALVARHRELSGG